MQDTNTSGRRGFVRRGWTGLGAIAFVLATGVCGDEPSKRQKPAADLGKSTGELLEDLAPAVGAHPHKKPAADSAESTRELLEDLVPEVGVDPRKERLKSIRILMAEARGIAVMLSVVTPEVDRETYLGNWILHRMKSEDVYKGVSPDSMKVFAEMLAEYAQRKHERGNVSSSKPPEDGFIAQRRCRRCGIFTVNVGICPLCGTEK